MKHFKLSPVIILSASLLFNSACGSSSAGKTNSSDGKASSPDAQTASSNSNLTGTDGRFSYTVNGTKVETVNYVQNANLFITEVSNDAANGMAKITVTCLGNNVFDFHIANSGASTIENHKPSLSDIMDKKSKTATYMDGKTYKNLYPVSVTITITSIDNSRVSGTFSGTFKAEESDGGETANITDGSFNLPFKKG